MQWSNSDPYKILVQAAWPLQHVNGVSRSSPPIRWCYYPQAEFWLFVGSLLVSIRRNVDWKNLIDNDIENLELAITYDSRNKPLYCGFLSVSSLDTCVPVDSSPGRAYRFINSVQVLHGLRMVSLIDISRDSYPNSGRMRSILACKSCVYLSKLDLTGYQVPQTTIVNCLKAAESTPRFLRLYALCNGDWVSAFDQLGDQFCLDAIHVCFMLLYSRVVPRWEARK